MQVEISDASIEECVQFFQNIAEFQLPHKTKEEYEKRIDGVKFLIQKATINKEIVGVKVGYALSDNIFYSWLGAVIKAHRRKGIAKSLALSQEKWAKRNGFSILRFKTLNKHKAMLIFALQNGFRVTNFQKKE